MKERKTLLDARNVIAKWRKHEPDLYLDACIAEGLDHAIFSGMWRGMVLGAIIGMIVTRIFLRIF